MNPQKIKSLIFDMDGVLWKEDTPIVDLKRIFSIIDNASKSYVFATNNSTKSPIDYVNKINRFGGKVKIPQIITSGTTLASKLLEKFPVGGPIFLIGENGLSEIFKSHGFFHQEEDVLAVVGGLDREITYQKLTRATLLINAGADFYFTNIDPSYPSPIGDIPGAGAILSFLETATGKKALTVGKPSKYMFDQAINILQSSRESTLVIGDRLETDIVGGMNANCKTVLLLSGISKRDDLEKSKIQPDLVCEDLDEFVTYMARHDWQVND
jgi:4-nitrophenyl phosphatase